MRRLLPLVLLMLVTVNCRVTSPRDDSETLAVDDRVWYDPRGEGSTCEASGSACGSFEDDRAFVDLCVSKGFQAKTCGCGIRCSGKLDYKSPVQKAPVPAASQATTAAGGKGCNAEARIEIDKVLAARKPGTSLDRCLDSHVCNGAHGSCTDGDLATTRKLRESARGACENDVQIAFCKDAFVDSLYCPEDDIRKLSRTWDEFQGRDSAVKRCLRNAVCSDDKSACTDVGLKQALALKASIDKDGCEYWLRSFCSLGGKAW